MCFEPKLLWGATHTRFACSRVRAHVLALRKITTPAAHFRVDTARNRNRSRTSFTSRVTCRLPPQRQSSHIIQDDQANQEGRRDVCIPHPFGIYIDLDVLTFSAAVNTVPGKFVAILSFFPRPTPTMITPRCTRTSIMRRNLWLWLVGGQAT